MNNSDFAIDQFRFLKTRTKHGRNYRRMSKIIVYSFFKDIVLTFVLFYYQADCGWSGTSLKRGLQWIQHPQHLHL